MNWEMPRKIATRLAMGKRIGFLVYMLPTEHERLKLQSRLMGKSMSCLIQDAVKRCLDGIDATMPELDELRAKHTETLNLAQRESERVLMASRLEGNRIVEEAKKSAEKLFRLFLNDRSGHDQDPKTDGLQSLKREVEDVNSRLKTLEVWRSATIESNGETALLVLGSNISAKRAETFRRIVNMVKFQTERLFLTVLEVARLLGLSKGPLYDRIGRPDRFNGISLYEANTIRNSVGNKVPLTEPRIPQFFTANEIALKLNMHVGSVRRWITLGRLKTSYRPGGRHTIDADAVAQMNYAPNRVAPVRPHRHSASGHKFCKVCIGLQEKASLGESSPGEL